MQITAPSWPPGPRRALAPWRTAAVAVAVALAASAGWPTTAAADEAGKHERPRVVVTGEATLRAAPDRALITLAVESRDADPKAAQRRNASAMSAVQEKLAGAGVPREAVRTLAYDLELQVDYDHGKRIPRGYLARDSIEVRVDAIERTGEILDLAVAAGVNEVGGIRFELKDRTALEREALRQAVADARARAEAAAAGAGVAIAEVLRIEQQGTAVEPRRPQAMEMRVASAASAPETPIRAGGIEVRAQVRLEAAIR